MKIGIISDTHDDIENVQRAIDIFNADGVHYVIHAGDYVFPGIITEFSKLNARLVGVLGNNDGERVHLLKNFMEIGGELKGEFGEVEVSGLRFGIYHGTDIEIKERLVNSGRYDIIICGHSHKREPTRLNGKYKNNVKTLVLNPGTAHKKVASVSGAFSEGGIIILDTSTKKYRFIDLP